MRLLTFAEAADRTEGQQATEQELIAHCAHCGRYELHYKLGETVIYSHVPGADGSVATDFGTVTQLPASHAEPDADADAGAEEAAAEDAADAAAKAAAEAAAEAAATPQATHQAAHRAAGGTGAAGGSIRRAQPAATAPQPAAQRTRGTAYTHEAHHAILKVSRSVGGSFGYSGHGVRKLSPLEEKERTEHQRGPERLLIAAGGPLAVLASRQEVRLVADEEALAVLVEELHVGETVARRDHGKPWGFGTVVSVPGPECLSASGNIMIPTLTVSKEIGKAGKMPGFEWDEIRELSAAEMAKYGTAKQHLDPFRLGAEEANARRKIKEQEAKKAAEQFAVEYHLWETVARRDRGEGWAWGSVSQLDPLRVADSIGGLSQYAYHEIRKLTEEEQQSLSESQQMVEQANFAAQERLRLDDEMVASLELDITQLSLGQTVAKRFRWSGEEWSLGSVTFLEPEHSHPLQVSSYVGSNERITFDEVRKLSHDERAARSQNENRAERRLKQYHIRRLQLLLPKLEANAEAIRTERLKERARELKERFSLGETVAMRDHGQDWLSGSITNLQPLEVSDEPGGHNRIPWGCGCPFLPPPPVACLVCLALPKQPARGPCCAGTPPCVALRPTCVPAPARQLSADEAVALRGTDEEKAQLAERDEIAAGKELEREGDSDTPLLKRAKEISEARLDLRGSRFVAGRPRDEIRFLTGEEEGERTEAERAAERKLLYHCGTVGGYQGRVAAAKAEIVETCALGRTVRRAHSELKGVWVQCFVTKLLPLEVSSGMSGASKYGDDTQEHTFECRVLSEQEELKRTAEQRDDEKDLVKVKTTIFSLL